MAGGVKKLLFIFVSLSILFLPVMANAQWAEPMAETSVHHDFTGGIYGQADFGSNAVTSMFAANLLLGNYINDNLKQQVSSRLMSSNRIGYLFNYGIYGVWYNDTAAQKRIFNIFVALRHKALFNVGFTPDVFNIAFYGNAMYAGKQAKLSPFSLNSVSYQQAEMGLVCTNFGGSAQLGMGVSFLAGQQFLSIAARNGTLYTDPTGQYLQINSDATMYQSDTSAGNNLARLNGYGASLDLYFRAPYKIGKHTGKVTVSVTDLGFIFWNTKSVYYNKDTSYYYDGVTINSLSDLQSVSFNHASKDSLQNKYLPQIRKPYYYTIPSTLSANCNTSFGRYHIESGFWYIFNANALGYFYLQGDKYFSHGWMMGLQAGVGGYQIVNSSLVLTKQTAKSALTVCINHLQGMVLPNYFGGAGAYLEYSHKF